MYFKKGVEIEEGKTNIWSCSNDDCSCWMRDNFAFEQNPTCPLCQSTMVIEEKILPVLTNHTYKVQEQS